MAPFDKVMLIGAIWLCAAIGYSYHDGSDPWVCAVAGTGLVLWLG